MIHSMTGFGRAHRELQGLSLSVELRSVNHRYLDMRIKLPSDFQYVETHIRTVAKEHVQRGRVECTVKLLKSVQGSSLPQIQSEVVQHYLKLYTQLAEEIGERGALPSLEAFLQLPGVLTEEKTDEQKDVVAQSIQEAVHEAMQQLVAMRHSEGLELSTHLKSLLTSYAEALSCVEERAPAIPVEQFERLKERLKSFSLEVEVDVARLHQEIAFFSERCDITEELKRIKSHIRQFTGFLDEGGAVGRRLDFLCQELLRETNTIGSKNVDEHIASQLISMKSDIEKLREQVQNVE